MCKITANSERGRERERERERHLELLARVILDHRRFSIFKDSSSLRRQQFSVGCEHRENNKVTATEGFRGKQVKAPQNDKNRRRREYR